MKGIIINRYGGPEVLEFRDDLACPTPSDGEVLVKVAYAGVNFMDIHKRQGKYSNSKSYDVRLPCILGMEGAGSVVATGPDVSGVSVGDRVAWSIAWGSYAEYFAIPAYRLAKLPDCISYDLAAAAIFQGSTAHYLVNDTAALRAGMTCLVHAALGSIGRLVCRMAANRGVEVYATASDDHKREIALSCGARSAFGYDSVVDRVDGTGSMSCSIRWAGRHCGIVFGLPAAKGSSSIMETSPAP